VGGALHVDSLKLRENKIKMDLTETGVPELYLESFGSQYSPLVEFCQ
jgi:hypothetical protein